MNDSTIENKRLFDKCGNIKVDADELNATMNTAIRFGLLKRFLASMMIIFVKNSGHW